MLITEVLLTTKVLPQINMKFTPSLITAQFNENFYCGVTSCVEDNECVRK